MPEFVWICLTLQSQMTRSALTILFWVIYVWLCRDSNDFFSDYFSGRAIYVWLCIDFDFHTEQLAAENRPTFRQVFSAEQGQIFFIRVVLQLGWIPWGFVYCFWHWHLTFCWLKQDRDQLKSLTPLTSVLDI